MRVGFIGLGVMGSRMAANLQKHGYSLALFNRTRAKAEPLLGPCGRDMHLATVSAYEAGVAMPLTNVTKEMYRLAMRGGLDAQDFSAIYEFTLGNNKKERNLDSMGDSREG
jgi:3-hydroxyisobutyrate dehydrogenase-like beta-hydroxyacid dehydrogenase